MKTTALILAAGESKRMGAGNKLLLELQGEPLLVWCLKVFQASPKINEIVLTAPLREIESYHNLVKQKRFSKVSQIVEGGATRCQSSLLGLKAIKETDFVAIHDAARPLLTKELLEKVLTAAVLHKAAILAIPAKDTLKKVSKDRFIQTTLLRDEIYLAQTPQVFKYDLILKAHKFAQDNSPLENRHSSLLTGFTDDAILVENLQEKVYVVESSLENIKITTPEDLVIAEAIVMSRGVRPHGT